MIHRLIHRTELVTAGPIKNPRYKERVYVDTYYVAAYDTRITKTGKMIYYFHHYVTSRLGADDVFELGYDDIPRGSLHNHSVEEEVLRRIDRGSYERD